MILNRSKNGDAMEIKNIFGDVIFALEGAKTVLELVTAAHAESCAALTRAGATLATLTCAALS